MKWVILLVVFSPSLGFAFNDQKFDYTCGSYLVYSINKSNKSADAFEILRNSKEKGNLGGAYFGKSGYKEAIADFVINNNNFSAEFNKIKITPDKKASVYRYDSEEKIYHQYETDVSSYELDGTQVIDNRSTDKSVKVLLDIPNDLSNNPVSIMSVFLDNKSDPVLFATWCQVFHLVPQKSKSVGPETSTAQR